jgi:hypothetical protein
VRERVFSLREKEISRDGATSRPSADQHILSRSTA